MKCNNCGKVFQYGTRSDNLPTGCGFVLSDGRRVDICTDCILKVGNSEAYLNDLKIMIDELHLDDVEDDNQTVTIILNEDNQEGEF